MCPTCDKEGDSDHVCIPHSKTSHPENPIPEEPTDIQVVRPAEGTKHDAIPSPSLQSTRSLTSDFSARTSEGVITPDSEQSFDSRREDAAVLPGFKDPADLKKPASTRQVASNNADVRNLLAVGNGGTHYVGRPCCGGGCCFLNSKESQGVINSPLVPPPANDAFRSLNIDISNLYRDTELTNVVDLPESKVSFSDLPKDTAQTKSTVSWHPPQFLTPHPPYEVFSARVHDARELTKGGAEKRTYHIELDVTDYPAEGGDVDFVVGGAIGICPSNPPDVVERVLDLLGVLSFRRDEPMQLHTTGMRWPTMWGEEEPRVLTTTPRELLTWCTDLQSFPPTKQLFRLLAEHADAPNERKILTYLAAAQGQAAFCDVRAGPSVTLIHLLEAFPSARPPLEAILSELRNLMPRFYSLSQDPHLSTSSRHALRSAEELPTASCDPSAAASTNVPEGPRRVVEVAVTVHEVTDWQGNVHDGVGSGFMARAARAAMAARAQGLAPAALDVRVPMFRGLMANPFAREFADDGPLLLVGAGVGIAPFRGFVQARLRTATCANRVWVLQGVRDALLDELYGGEWGVDEARVKTVVQSRRGAGRYVQDEVRNQADLVWFVINAVHGRLFVCGSGKGMGEGVERALVDVAMDKGNLNHDQAAAFWGQKKSEGQYVTETW